MENDFGRKQGMFVFFTRIPEIATRILYMLHAHCNGSHLIGLKESNGGRKRDFSFRTLRSSFLWLVALEWVNWRQRS